MNTYIVKLTDHDGNIVYHECSTYGLALRAGESMVKAHGGTFEITPEEMETDNGKELV